MTFPACCRGRARSWRSEPTAERRRADAAIAVTDVTLTRDLAGIVGADHVLPGERAPYGEDATRERVGLCGVADAVVRPAGAEEVRRVVAWCYERGVPIVPRGGGTGLAGGAVPVDGGVVVSMERLTAVRSFDGPLWRAELEAGLTTATVARLAREHGLLFPPNPGAAEQSHIGGNVATNAGGPRAFKYGVTGSWVTGLEVVVAPGELIRIGGARRKDVAGYDLRSLFVGSEGTLGIVTSVWLRFVPAPAATARLATFYPDLASGCAAIEQLVGNGVLPAALEYVDEGALEAARRSFPGTLPAQARFIVLIELDGSVAEVAVQQAEALDALAGGSIGSFVAGDEREGTALWRWRDALSGAVTAVRGGRLGEDIMVPLDCLADVIGGAVRIGARHGLPACSWGHAGDGNVHANFLIAAEDADARGAAEQAATELCDLAVSLGGSISGEHGIGWLKRGRLERHWGPVAAGLHAAIKTAFDPKNLLNPGKKT
jgi:glycolate oxidase subunit GlcD